MNAASGYFRRSRAADVSELSDEALVQQALGLNDAGAFEQLVRRHQRKVLMLQRRFCRDPALAEDLCQETFLRAWRKLSSLATTTSPISNRIRIWSRYETIRSIWPCWTNTTCRS